MDLKELRNVVNQACEAAYAKRSEIDGAINWGDLGCIEALRCEDDNGRITYRVTVEECSPDNPELRDFIVEALIAAGLPTDVEINFEW